MPYCLKLGFVRVAPGEEAGVDSIENCQVMATGTPGAMTRKARGSARLLGMRPTISEYWFLGTEGQDGLTPAIWIEEA